MTPTLAATYKEGNVQRGVLVLQRQMLESTGEPLSSHAQPATISVYIFKFDGTNWVYEKGKKNVLEAGSWGNAPGGSLAKIGSEKYGLYFNTGWGGQGYHSSGAFIININDKNFIEAGNFNLSEDNSGTCSDDPKEQDGSIVACWGYKGETEFISKPDAVYYMLRISYDGTEFKNINGRDKIVRKNKPICYTYTGNKYVVNKDHNCASYTALDMKEIFDEAVVKRAKHGAAVKKGKP